MKFWVYVNGKVPGCFTAAELARVPGFSSTALVCPAEGEIAEKNWRRAGEFAEIMPFLQEPARQPAPIEPPAPADVDQLIDTAGSRIFSHVADLMKELENRREEKALILSLQRQILDLKDRLLEARERAAKLEDTMPRITELEEAARKNEDRIQSLEAALQGRDAAVTELRIHLEKATNELENAKLRLGETSDDLAIRNRLVDKLSRELTDKELSLAKALGLLRRFEEDLHRICPEAMPPESREQIRQLSAPPAPQTPLPAAYTTDEPPKLPEVIAPAPQQPAAHNALIDFLKKIVNNPEH